MDNQEFEVIQQRIGYRFHNPDLLQQAFVRRSYSAEKGGCDNEVLEFIGDKVLDLMVVKLLTERYGCMMHDFDDYDPEQDWDEFDCEKDEAELTQLKTKLVQRRTLAERIDALGLADYLITGKGDTSQNQASVKEDLFEAIVGAAAIDSNWDLEELENLVELMLDPDSVISEEEDNYMTLIQKWTAKKGIGIPLYHFRKGGYQETWYTLPATIDQRLDLFQDSELASHAKYHCYLWISNELKVFRGFGRSKSEARYNACATAWNHLQEQGLLFSVRDEIPDPSREQAISQLEILARRGYFSLPEYDFTQNYDDNGNPVWRCAARIAEYGVSADSVSSSKKDAKKTAAYTMLKTILKQN